MIESCCRYIYVNYKFLCFDLYTAVYMAVTTVLLTVDTAKAVDRALTVRIRE